MSDKYITLLGAEEVQRAASRMSSAADTMQQAAVNLDGALERHQRFMDDWLLRLEIIAKSADRIADALDKIAVKDRSELIQDINRAELIKDINARKRELP